MHHCLRPLFAVLCLCFLAACPSQAAELRTPSYVVRITENCPEGEVGCQDVSYFGKSIRTGKSIVLKGQAVMRLCADRVTPCSHEGYRFTRGPVEYRVTPQGLLRVTRGSEVLVEEQGKWQAAATPAALARSLGVQPGSSYAAARARILGASWSPDLSQREFSLHAQPEYPQYPEVMCGDGRDAVCSGRFVKSGQAIVVSIDPASSTLRVTSVDED